ncbi:MAG: hypothetical protein ACHP65_07685 [Legionellales bacterium]
MKAPELMLIDKLELLKKGMNDMPIELAQKKLLSIMDAKKHTPTIKTAHELMQQQTALLLPLVTSWHTRNMLLDFEKDLALFQNYNNNPATVRPPILTAQIELYFARRAFFDTHFKLLNECADLGNDYSNLKASFMGGTLIGTNGPEPSIIEFKNSRFGVMREILNVLTREVNDHQEQEPAPCEPNITMELIAFMDDAVQRFVLSPWLNTNGMVLKGLFDNSFKISSVLYACNIMINYLETHAKKSSSSCSIKEEPSESDCVLYGTANSGSIVEEPIFVKPLPLEVHEVPESATAHSGSFSAAANSNFSAGMFQAAPKPQMEPLPAKWHQEENSDSGYNLWDGAVLFTPRCN